MRKLNDVGLPVLSENNYKLKIYHYKLRSGERAKDDRVEESCRRLEFRHTHLLQSSIVFSICALSPKPVMMRLTPRLASAWAQARPMPLVDPVTNATLLIVGSLQSNIVKRQRPFCGIPYRSQSTATDCFKPLACCQLYTRLVNDCRSDDLRIIIVFQPYNCSLHAYTGRLLNYYNMRSGCMHVK